MAAMAVVEIFCSEPDSKWNRMKMKVNRNTSLLQVLEEACQQQGFDAREYGLKHQNKFVDLSLTIRFSNIPNNAKLDLVQALVRRGESQVTVALQTDSVQRLVANFVSTTNLWTILNHWQDKEGQVNLDGGSVNDVPVVIYMMSEISGEENLKKTTLKSLGVIDGSAVLRLTYRPKDFVLEQAYSSDKVLYSPQVKPVSPQNVKGTNTEVSAVDELMSTTGTDNSKDETKVCGYSMASNRLLKELIVNLGERDGILLDLRSVPKIQYEDIPDSFFDVKKMYSDLQTQSKNLEDQPLETTEPLGARLQQQASQYSEAIVSIHFPDRMVLRGKFKIDETVADVMKFVTTYLSDSNLDFYLYTAPPKAVLNPKVALMEAQLFPKAIVHFGTDAEGHNFLKEDSLESPEFVSSTVKSKPIVEDYVETSGSSVDSVVQEEDPGNDIVPPLVWSPTNSPSTTADWTPHRNFLIKAAYNSWKEKLQEKTVKEAKKFPEFVNSSPEDILKDFEERGRMENERQIRLKDVYDELLKKGKTPMISSVLAMKEFRGFNRRHISNKLRNIKPDNEKPPSRRPKRKSEASAQITEAGGKISRLSSVEAKNGLATENNGLDTENNGLRIENKEDTMINNKNEE